MKKLLAILSSIGLVATSSSAVVSCSLGFTNDGGSIGGGTRTPDTQGKTAINPVDIDVDDPKALAKYKDDLILKGKTLEDWQANYEIYSEAYGENINAYEENKNYQPDDPNMSDQDKKDEEDEKETNMQMELAFFSMYKIMKAYSLSEMYLLWNNLPLETPNFNGMTVEDLKTSIMEFYDVQVAKFQWDKAYENLKENFLTEEDEKLVWSMVDDAVNNFYFPQATVLLNAANLVLVAKSPTSINYLADVMNGNYLQFDPEFDNEIATDSTTVLKPINTYAWDKDNKVIDVSKYKIDPKTIYIYDEKGAKIVDSTGVKVEIDTDQKGIAITVAKEIRKGYRVSFNIKGDGFLKDPLRKLDETITLMVVDKK